MFPIKKFEVNYLKFESGDRFLVTSSKFLENWPWKTFESIWMYQVFVTKLVMSKKLIEVVFLYKKYLLVHTFIALNKSKCSFL